MDVPIKDYIDKRLEDMRGCNAAEIEAVRTAVTVALAAQESTTRTLVAAAGVIVFAINVIVAIYIGKGM